MNHHSEEGMTCSNFFWYVKHQNHTLHSLPFTNFYLFFMYSNTTFYIFGPISDGSVVVWNLGEGHHVGWRHWLRCEIHLSPVLLKANQTVSTVVLSASCPGRLPVVRLYPQLHCDINNMFFNTFLPFVLTLVPSSVHCHTSWSLI